MNNKGNKSSRSEGFYIDGKHGTLPANGGGSKVKVCGGAIIKVGNVNPSGNGMNGNVYALEGKAPLQLQQIKERAVRFYVAQSEVAIS